eukprot:14307823-Alexandrium_andersonii.AAC.1
MEAKVAHPASNALKALIHCGSGGGNMLNRRQAAEGPTGKQPANGWCTHREPRPHPKAAMASG